jgi:hypothetical protein
MIRIDLDRIPERWHPVSFLDEEGDPQEVRIRYALLDLDAVVGYRREQMTLALQGVGMRDDEPDPQARQAFLEGLVARLEPEEVARRQAVLTQHLRGWEFVGPDDAPIPFEERTVAAVVRRSDLFAPLWDGLLEASEGASKKPVKSGSTGGRTTTRRG